MKAWILECFTEGVDGEAAWRHLVKLVKAAKRYRNTNGEFPGMVMDKEHGLLKLREDHLAKYFKRDDVIDQIDGVDGLEGEEKKTARSAVLQGK